MSTKPFKQSRESILVIDDVPENLRLLAEILSGKHYKVRVARNGATGIESALVAPPDLILLDIMMPGMDGYQVCEQLKANARTQDIPVIFITAMNQVSDKVRAFSMGGVDYITKPFQVKEVLARVEIHLTLKHTQHQLQAHIEELDAFAHTVAHDLKNPLAVIQGFSYVLKTNIESMDKKEIAKYLTSLDKAAAKATNIIDELLLLAGVKNAEVAPHPIDMAPIVNNALQRINFMLIDTPAEINQPQSWPVALGYRSWVEEVWVNYLSNGLKYGGQPPRLELGATTKNATVRFWVKDNGCGLSEEEKARLFTEFTRLNKVRVEGHGLGLAIVRRIIEKLNGQVGVESSGIPGEGSLFYFELPVVTE
jgi:signal transduction histidine kinase